MRSQLTGPDPSMAEVDELHAQLHKLLDGKDPRLVGVVLAMATGRFLAGIPEAARENLMRSHARAVVQFITLYQLKAKVH